MAILKVLKIAQKRRIAGYVHDGQLNRRTVQGCPAWAGHTEQHLLAGACALGHYSSAYHTTTSALLNLEVLVGNT